MPHGLYSLALFRHVPWTSVPLGTSVPLRRHHVKPNESQAAAYPVLSISKPPPRRERVMTITLSLLVLAAVGLMVAAMFIDTVGHR